MTFVTQSYCFFRVGPHVRAGKMGVCGAGVLMGRVVCALSAWLSRVRLSSSLGGMVNAEHCPVSCAQVTACGKQASPVGAQARVPLGMRLCVQKKSGTPLWDATLFFWS